VCLEHAQLGRGPGHVRGDNNDCIPYFAESFANWAREYVFDSLAPCVAKSTGNSNYTLSAVFRWELRKCPGGFVGPDPPSGAPRTDWNCWIGCNFASTANPLYAPFYYHIAGSQVRAPCKTAAIKKPSEALMLMDTSSYYVYSPADPAYKFNGHSDDDGIADTLANYAPYSRSRPTVHNNGANLTMLDGRVERVPFKRLWKIDAQGKWCIPTGTWTARVEPTFRARRSLPSGCQATQATVVVVLDACVISVLLFMTNGRKQPPVRQWPPR